MTYRTRKALVKDWNEGAYPEFLMFWGRKGNDTSKVGPYVFSQWHHSDFEIEGITYGTAEHWMMAEKARLMGDQQTLELILANTVTKNAFAEPDPGIVKNLGKKVSPWDETKWNEHKFEIVVKGNVAKFGQDQTLRHYLLSTGRKVLVEASPQDVIWGIGLRREDKASQNPSTWRGENLLGFAIMEARKRIRETT